MAAGQVRAYRPCSVSLLLCPSPSPFHSCTFLIQARVVGAAHVAGGLGGGRRRWRRGRYVPANLARCACMVFFLTNALPACSCCCAAGRRCRALSTSTRRSLWTAGTGGFPCHTLTSGRCVARLITVSLVPFCCAAGSRRRAPALGGAAGTCCSLQYPALLLSLCAWLYAHLPTYFLAAPPAAGTRAVRYSRRRHGLHGGLDGGGGGAGTCRAVQYPAPSGSMCV